MAGSVHDQIITNSNYSAQAKAQTDAMNAKAGSSSTVNSQEFLHLLTEQLKYQDPMNPMDNSEMLAQEAQFATLEQMEALTSNFSQFSTMYQANSLLGQHVEVVADGSKTSGKVEFVDYSDSEGAAVSVGGKMFPLSAITRVYPQDEQTPAITQDDTNFLKAAANSIATNLGSITQKLFGYENNGGSTDSNTQTESNTTN